MATGDHAQVIQYLGTVYNIHPAAETGVVITPTLKDRLQPLLDRHNLFGGREDELRHLTNLLRDNPSGYIFVTGPAGFGKTALLVNWIKGLQQNGTAVCYHFLSQRDGLAGEDFTLMNLCQQLVYYHDLGGPLPSSTPVLRALYPKLLSIPAAENDKLFIVIDGLDEAVGWNPSSDLFPHSLPDGVFVVFSAREIAERDWLATLELPRARVLDVLRLQTLGIAEIAHLLRAAEGDAARWADDPDFLTGIFQRSTGDPFYLRYLVEDIRDGRIASLAEIKKQPRGLKRYLDTWWQDVSKETGEQAVRDLLGYLLVAKDRLTRDDLTYISDADVLDSWVFDQTIEHVQRYVVGDETQGYALTHPRFQAYLSEERIKDRDQDPYLQRLLEYCARWSEHHSNYAMQYLVAHLADAGNHEALWKVLTEEDQDGRNVWYEAHAAAPDDHLDDTDRLRWYVHDLEQAQGIFYTSDQPLPRSFELALMWASVNSMSISVSGDLLAALVEHGQRTLKQALAVALQNPDLEMRVEALTALAPKLDEPLRSEALREALTAAMAIHKYGHNTDFARARALTKLSPHLPEPLLRETLEVARKVLPVKDEDRRYPRAYALARLIPRLAELRYPQEALDAIRAIKGGPYMPEYYGAWALAAMGDHLPKELLDEALGMAYEMRPERRAAVIAGLLPRLEEPRRTEALKRALDKEALDDIPEIERNLKYRGDWGLVLDALSPYLPEELLRETLGAAQRIAPNQWGFILAPLVARLAELGYWQEARDIARQTNNQVWQARMLARILPHAPENERLSVLHEAWGTAPMGWKDDLLRHLHSPVPAQFLREKFKDLQEIDVDKSYGDLTLAELAPRLAEVGCYQEALQAVEALGRAFEWKRRWSDDSHHATLTRTQVAVAVHLPEPLRGQKLEEALHAAQEIGDASVCASAIAELEHYLPEPILRKARDNGAVLVQAAVDGRLPESPLPVSLQSTALDAARAIPESFERSFGGKTWTELSPKRAQALAALVPRLSEPFRSEALREAQGTAQRIDNAFEQVKTLASLARYLPEVPPVPKERLREALHVAQQPEDGEERERRLAALGPYRPELSPQDAAEALRRDEGRRRQVEERIVAFNEHRKPENIISPVSARDQVRLERRAILIAALKTARGIGNADERARALTQMVPHLDELLRTVILESDAFHPRDSIRTQAEVQRSEVLHALSPYLPEHSLQRVLDNIEAIEDPDERERALSALILRRGYMSSASLRQLWSEALRIFAARTRRRLLKNLSTLLPTLVLLGGAEAVDETASAIRDVARWWP